ncbi:hypothetical protein B296_00054989 [Ensete ventricosum]|uniref:Uncharacterized protein n=1 Tax=Ensete ventricosum TaxID=4639 RepID=A0A426Y1J5_ENSVE|nr:hypothetical protein B296_00054989 [Ensete ventricosum]
MFVRCSVRQQRWQGEAAAAGATRSDCDSKQVRQQLRRRKAAVVFLLARDAGSKEGRDSGYGERAATTR